MTHVTVVIFQDLNKNMCSTESCHVCAWAHTFWLVVATAACILSFQGCVVPNLSSVSATFWIVVLLQAVFCYHYCYLFLVVPLSVTDSTWCHILWERGLNFVSVAGFSEGRHIRDLWLRQGQGVSWDSVWSMWTSADHRLGIDYQSIDDWLWSMTINCVFIINRSILCYWSMIDPCPALLAIMP